MKKGLLLLLMTLLIPGMVCAVPTLGLYFSPYFPGPMANSPPGGIPFDMYMFLANAPYYVTAIEYQLVTPDDPAHAWVGLGTITYPPNKAVALGDPFSGHSISYWPPMNGYIPGYNLMCIIQGMLFEPCHDEGGLVADYHLVIGPHPGSGAPNPRGTYAPDNLFFNIVGLTSVLCPLEIATEEKSWGAIKSMYK